MKCGDDNGLSSIRIVYEFSPRTTNCGQALPTRRFWCSFPDVVPAKTRRVSPRQCEEIARVCGCYNLRRATRAVTQLFDEALAPAGLRSTQLVLLVAIGAHEEASMAQLADAMVMDRSTLTRNLQPLERSGWIRILPGADRRVRLVSLTAKGHHIILQAMPRWQRTQEEVMRQSGRNNWRQLLQRLDAATEATTAAGAALKK
jgi:DNA-binding MarR family transcriptional regulator